MTYPASWYAKAFAEAVSVKKGNELETAIERFLALIRKHGDWTRKDDILAACEAELRAREGKEFLLVESARELEKNQKEMIEQSFSAQRYDIVYRIERSLGAGIRLTKNGSEQMDVSLNKILATIFNS